MTRRRFIQSTAGAFAAVSAYGLIPSSAAVTDLTGAKTGITRRKLGKTGLGGIAIIIWRRITVSEKSER